MATSLPVALPAFAVPYQSSQDDPSSSSSSSETDSDQSEDPAMAETPTWGTPTLGGMQFWGDLAFLQGWKIQRNVLTGHCRLLDDRDFRFASGSLEECERALETVARSRGLSPDEGEVVILCHGIGRSSKSFSGMASALKAEGYTVVRFEYPSTRLPLEQSCRYLESVIQSLTRATSIHFVVHSMGGLLVRMLVREFPDTARLGNLVMLGTPNQGAEMADMLKSNYVFRLVYGPAGQQLATDPAGIIAKLPTPTFPFGIIAGGRGDGEGFNPLLKGDDDGTVTVDSCKLEGAADFRVVNRIHSFLMNDPEVIRATISFLKSSRFSEG